MNLCDRLTKVRVIQLMREATSAAERLETHICEPTTVLSEIGLAIDGESVADGYVGHVTSAVEEICSPDGDREFVVKQLWRDHD